MGDKDLEEKVSGRRDFFKTAGVAKRRSENVDMVFQYGARTGRLSRDRGWRG